MTDPIADMLTRLRNALAVKKSEVVLPMSKLKYSVAKTLEKEGWVKRVEVLKADSEKNSSQAFDNLRIELSYNADGKPTITSLKKISKPGLKVYAGLNELPRVLNNRGIAIISTSQGVMSNKEARKKKIGGEVICEIY